MASRQMFGVPVVLLAAFVAAGPAGAQGRASSAAAHSASFASSRRTQTPPFISGRRSRINHRDRSFYNSGLFYYPDMFPDAYDSSEPVEPMVQPIIVQPSVAAQPQQPAAKSIEPLVLEDRNGQWMRVPVGSQVSVNAQPNPPNGVESRRPSATSGWDENSGVPALELPPAVLVFRDGHREQVRNYMIQGNDLYTSADYWSTGSWTKKIPLADLDVPATLRLNADRGAEFNLPRSPNQVIVRF